MRRAPFIPLLALVLPTVLFAADSPPSLTLYNQNFAVVREHVPLDLKEGENTVTTTAVTAHLEPESVILRDPSGKVALRILEQNYRNDPVSQDLLLQHFEGKEIEFERLVDQKLATVKGRIVRAPYAAHEGGLRTMGQPYQARQMAMVAGGGNVPIIEVEGKLRFSLPGQPLFPALADDSILKPTLSWTIQADAALTSPAELSYVSGGFGWAADYNLVAPETGNDVSMIGWITMQNESGRTFQDAVIKLMAGDVSKIQPQQEAGMGRMMAFAAKDESQVTEKAFDEYHLYSLGRATTLRDRETKQVEFVRAEKVKGKLLYIYNGAGIDWNRYRGWNPEQMRDDRSFGTQSNKKVWVYREFENTKENGLGVPLPKGRVRFYRQDSDGRLEFVGENEIDHTPKNETVKLYTGDAFDIVGERKRMDYTLETGRNTLVEKFEIQVRNRKELAVEVKVVEDMYRWPTWEITEASEKWKKTDAQQIEIPVSLQPDEEKTVNYTVRYTW